MSYSDKLKDPRWQRRRLEVMERAGFRCESCHSTLKTLNTHHRYYVSGREPWEYPDCAFKCLCDDCHTGFSVTDGFRLWEKVMTETESRGADPVSLLFLLDAAGALVQVKPKEDAA